MIAIIKKNYNKVTNILTRTVLLGVAVACCATAYASTQPNTVCLSTCVTLQKPALRVVALNWSSAEMLLSLGIVPVGVAQIKSYKKWQTNHPAMPTKGVQDVGRRQEPNLAYIAKLQPDLIIGYNFRHARMHSKLTKIAPTLLYKQFPSVGDDEFRYFDQSLRIFNAIAQATGTTANAKTIVKNMHVRLQNLSASITNKSRKVVYAKFVGMGYGLRFFADKSLAGSVIKKLGLQYAWRNYLPNKDFSHMQIEQLPQLQDYHVLLAGNQSKNVRMEQSPVWQQLPFVRKGHIYAVEPLWSFGGPVSIIRMAEEFTQALNKTNK